MGDKDLCGERHNLQCTLKNPFSNKYGKERKEGFSKNRSALTPPHP